MNFDAAMESCKPGQYVKQRRSGWNEHHIQYGRDENNQPFWTAGNTVGGPLRDSYLNAARKYDDYQIFANFEDTFPLS